MSKVADKINNMKKIAGGLKDSLGKKGIRGEDMPELTIELIELAHENEWFCKDIVTGTIKSSLVADGRKTVTEDVARNLFDTYLAERIRIKKWKVGDDGQMEADWKRLNKSDLDTLFKNLLDNCTFNSREEFYKNIPKWDGVPRIDTFMQKYFKCESKPSFFWLFMTSVVGKMKDPAGCYSPYWFDFVGEKGVGNTYFFRRLVGDYVQTMHPRSRVDDMYVELYDANAVIANDDEACCVGNKYGQLSYDQWKEFVTTSKDTFSRKFCQPETHPRSFVPVRTSNEIKTVHSLTERRQIIFESLNEPNECYVKDLPDEIFKQLLAEAKAFYERNGLYNLDAEDLGVIKRQNIEYINSETYDVECMRNFILSVRGTNSYRANTTRSGEWYGWSEYGRWATNIPASSRITSDKIFWKSAKILEVKEGIIEVPKVKVRTRDRGPLKLFRVLGDVELKKKQKEMGLADE